MISNCTDPWCEVFFSLFLSNLRAKNKDDNGTFIDFAYVVHVAEMVSLGGGGHTNERALNLQQ
jgi:hypothetical protein